jgi:hypothetical protein
MKLILVIVCLSLCHFSVTFAQQEGLDPISTPSISRRCQEMMVERNDKVAIKQRLNSLSERNQRLLKNIPKKRVAMEKQLKATQFRIKNELYLSTMQVETMEEKIIRSGCPGISL